MTWITSCVDRRNIAVLAPFAQGRLTDPQTMHHDGARSSSRVGRETVRLVIARPVRQSPSLQPEAARGSFFYDASTGREM